MLNKPDHCKSCQGWNWGCNGYVPASGTGENGVLVVAEAAGEHETNEGMPLVGKAGYFLWQQLQRVGISREGFKLHNVLSCRPPNNKLAKEPYEADVIASCAPLLDATIEGMQETCKRNGKQFTIVTLGRIAFKRIMGLTDKDPILHIDYQCYPIWSEKYKAYVIAADHPAYLMRGYTHLVPVLQFAFKRALEIAEKGLKKFEPLYMRDPDPSTFSQWVNDYENAFAANPEILLAFDIETPHKQGQDEEEVAKEDDDDYTILRCSFAYKTGEAVSVPWRAEYRPYLEELLSSPGRKTVWNASYDVPRISAQMPIHGDIWDAMLMWHVLNSAMPKGLGFVTPFYCQNMPLWKHLSGSDPAGYNAQDSDALLVNALGIKQDLVRNQLWHVFDRHVVQLNRVLEYMSEKGVPLDMEMRKNAEKQLQELLDVVEIHMQAAVPQQARRLSPKNGYTKRPKNVEGMVETGFQVELLRCLRCNVLGVSKNHAKPKKKGNPCDGAEVVKETATVTRWAKVLDFKVSKLGLSKYQKVLQHHAIIDRKEQKVTFDEKAILKLAKHYPNDPLYPRILEHRQYQKLLSTYIGVTNAAGVIRGGMPVGPDGRVHTTYSHNPSTLRLASQHPNLQNLPRPTKNKEDLGNLIRNFIIAQPGSLFLARDYSGIEAVLVGYFACAPRYIRLAKIDVHSFYTAYALHELDGRVSANDLPLLSWDDERLTKRLGEIKREFGHDRNSLYKHLIHGGNFKQGPKGAQEKIFLETGIEYPVSLVAKVMGIYFELFPEIPKWHNSLLLQAEKDGFVRNPFGYIHRFNKVFDYEKIGGNWERKPGPDTNKVIAFLPQSTAAGIIKEALLRIYFNRFSEAGQYLRLQVHDEVFTEVPEEQVKPVDLVLQEEMERPIDALPLPASYGMGKNLIILTENKLGKRWGSMK